MITRSRIVPPYKGSALARRTIAWAAAAVCLSACALDGCQQRAGSEQVAATGGDVARGRSAIERYACSVCHTIPGVAGPDVLVGPPLDHVSRQVYLAGVLANTPPNLIRWIEHPTQVDPLTAMPDLGVTPADARDIAAYLYSR